MERWLIFYNVILWNICFLMAYSRSIRRGYSVNRSCCNDQAYKQLFFLFAMFSLFTFFGGDIKRDLEFVKEEFEYADLYEHIGREQIYVFFASISHKHLFIYKVLIYIPALIFTSFSLKLTRKDNYVTLLLFVMFALTSYGATRGVLAFSIFVLGVIFYCREKLLYKALGIAIMLSSYFFHATMLAVFVLFMLSHIKLKKPILLILVLLFPVFVKGIDVVMSLFDSGGLLSAFEYATYKFQNYTEQHSDMTSYGSILTTISDYLNMFFILGAFLYALKSYFKTEVRKESVLLFNTGFFLLYFALVFRFSDMPANQMLYSRLFGMCPFFLYLPYADYFTVNGNVRKGLLFFAWFAFIKINYMFMTLFYYSAFN